MSRQFRFFNLAARQTISRRGVSTPSVDPAAVRKNVEGVAGKLTGFAEPIIYYSRVGLEFLRSVAVHQKLAIPNVENGMSGLTNFYSAFKNGAWKKVTLRQTGQLAAEGIKISGFFLVGEMIGKGSVIGYQIEGTEHHAEGH
ncbi:uncharacterized protein SPPG_06614 [Spizellomyces punctatus DAOM BR117]|uniref:Uncharacterized protein n=1 Tax=Spizellomyces punctatus (strain DAOM BR117) TaxID=645134 RepID=A0A0L0HBH5_SPIPD|nr:uncharacterized protein SPPG_06614 [Spizellomyces punctatus DAOM BR117]KNC98214.1 hypothetical protein SPPG_06614 [Spizellomyces punctatus DAOM BR117]|eukprot:XP_016606254.1 hypothetical protein SPPG_06614 [Spizellomyces punctatus DAOM BR117]